MPSISAMNTVVPLEIIEVQEFNSANADIGIFYIFDAPVVAHSLSYT